MAPKFGATLKKPAAGKAQKKPAAVAAQKKPAAVAAQKKPAAQDTAAGTDSADGTGPVNCTLANLQDVLSSGDSEPGDTQSAQAALNFPPVQSALLAGLRRLLARGTGVVGSPAQLVCIAAHACY